MLTFYHRANTKFCHIYSLILIQIHMIFSESIINFPIVIPESTAKLNVFTWLITFYWITRKFFPNIKHNMNAPETFCVLPILTFYYFSCISYFKHLNPALYSLLKEMSNKYLDRFHCQLLSSSTGIFIYTFKIEIFISH